MKIELGKYGVWQSAFATTAEMAVEIERLGFTALWLGGPPVGPKGIDEPLQATAAPVVGSSIVNVWPGDPAGLAAAHPPGTAPFPARMVPGIRARPPPPAP